MKNEKEVVGGNGIKSMWGVGVEFDEVIGWEKVVLEESI